MSLLPILNVFRLYSIIFLQIWINPSKCLVERALKLWSTTKMRADNTSVVTLMLDPPGPPRAQVLRNRKKSYPDSGLQIMTRYQNESQNQHKENTESPEKPTNTIPEHNPQILKPITSYRTSLPLSEEARKDLDEASSSLSGENHNKKTYVLKPRASLTFDPNSASTWGTHTSKPVESVENLPEKLTDVNDKEMVEDSNESKEERCLNCKKVNDAGDVSISSSEASSSDTSKLNSSEENIQINEISSSSNELEDEEIARLKPENFSKGNFRRCRSRASLRKVVKKPDKSEPEAPHGRKRSLSEPLESKTIKKARMSPPSDLEQIRHNLRIRKVNTTENVAKKHEEMVNQVDSTNKEFQKKVIRRRKVKSADPNSIDVDITKGRQTRFSSKKNIRKSQRLKSKLNINKLVDKIKNKANKMKKVNKKILLVRKKVAAKQQNLRKPGRNNNDHHQRGEAVTSSNKSPSRILKSASLSNRKVKEEIPKRPTVRKVKQVCVTSSSTKKTKSERTFKMGYVGKLRRNTSRRNQKK